jgi:hypothetical protein
MAESPSSEESARAILEYFAQRRLGGGGDVPKWALEQQFLENPIFGADDFEAGTSYAIEKQWLIQNGELFVLTEYGFRELPSIW